MSVVELFGDETSRRILTAVAEQPRSAEQLSEVCNVSVTSVYRKTDLLESHGLLESERKLDDRGNHYRVYRTCFRGVFVCLDDGELRAECVDDDHLRALWEQLREADE